MTTLEAENIVKKKLWAFGYRVRKAGDILLVDGKYRVHVIPTDRKKLMFHKGVFKDFDVAAIVMLIGREFGSVVKFAVLRDEMIEKEDSPYKVFGMPAKHNKPI